MAKDNRPTNESIIKQLELISRQLAELRETQKQMANDLKRVTKSG